MTQTQQFQVAVEHHARIERPTLVLGLIGFPSRNECDVASLLATCSGRQVDWRLGGLAEADAWWANGSRAQLLSDGSIRVGAAAAGARSVRLTLEEVDRPIAFSEPLACADLEPAWRFSLSDPAAMRQTIVAMEKWLAVAAVQLRIAATVIARHAELSGRLYHLLSGGTLVAIVDRLGEVAIRPSAVPEDIGNAVWAPRPASAPFIPATFHRISFSELIWRYALRTRLDLLPSRYRARPIHLRRPPRVPTRLLNDHHLSIMHALTGRPTCFGELLEATAMPQDSLDRALAALYLTGSITTNPARMTRGRAEGWGDAGSALDTASQWNTGSRMGAEGMHVGWAQRDFTVPARLSPPGADDRLGHGPSASMSGGRHGY